MTNKRQGISDREYVANPDVCPVCGSATAASGAVDVDINFASQTAWCTECRASWINVYKLIGYTDPCDDDGEPIERASDGEEKESG